MTRRDLPPIIRSRPTVTLAPVVLDHNPPRWRLLLRALWLSLRWTLQALGELFIAGTRPRRYW